MRYNDHVNKQIWGIFMSEVIDSSDREEFIGLQSMIKYSCGYFKSIKQSRFFFKNKNVNLDMTAEFAKSWYGIDFDPKTQMVISVHGVYHWAHGKGKVPMLYMYVFDRLGIVARYKIGGNGNLKDGWKPCAKKCKKEWYRLPEFEAPEWASEIEKPVEFKELKIEEMCPPSGRHTFRGKVLSGKWVYQQVNYGVHVSSYKVIIQEERGYKIYGSLENKLIEDIDEEDMIGKEIEFSASIKVSNEDPQFGFFSRPTKSKLINTEEIKLKLAV